MRGAAVLATLLELVGFALVVAAAYLVALPLALLVAGVGLVVGAQVMPARKPRKAESRS